MTNALQDDSDADSRTDRRDRAEEAKRFLQSIWPNKDFGVPPNILQQKDPSASTWKEYATLCRWLTTHKINLDSLWTATPGYLLRACNRKSNGLTTSAIRAVQEELSKQYPNEHSGILPAAGSSSHILKTTSSADRSVTLSTEASSNMHIRKRQGAFDSPAGRNKFNRRETFFVSSGASPATRNSFRSSPTMAAAAIETAIQHCINGQELNELAVYTGLDLICDSGTQTLGGPQAAVADPPTAMQYPCLVIPQCVGSHWTVSVADVSKREVVYFGSLAHAQPGEDREAELQQTLTATTAVPPAATTPFTVMSRESALQVRDKDSGVFAVANGLYFILTGAPAPAVSTNLWRHVLAVALSTGRQTQAPPLVSASTPELPNSAQLGSYVNELFLAIHLFEKIRDRLDIESSVIDSKVQDLNEKLMIASMTWRHHEKLVNTLGMESPNRAAMIQKLNEGKAEEEQHINKQDHLRERKDHVELRAAQVYKINTMLEELVQTGQSRIEEMEQHSAKIERLGQHALDARKAYNLSLRSYLTDVDMRRDLSEVQIDLTAHQKRMLKAEADFKEAIEADSQLL